MKNMTINDIIAFISKAQEKKAVILNHIDEISVWNDKDEYCYIYIDRKLKKLDILNDRGKFKIDLSESDIHLYDVLVDTIEKYSENNAIEQFKSFFKTKEDSPKEVTINDLNDED